MSNRGYKWAIAGLLALAILIWGFVPPLLLRTVLTVCIGGFASALAFKWSRSVYGVGPQDVPRRRRRFWELDLASSLFLVICIAGLVINVEGRAWYWIPAALVVAAPLAISALRTRHP